MLIFLWKNENQEAFYLLVFNLPIAQNWCFLKQQLCYKELDDKHYIVDQKRKTRALVLKPFIKPVVSFSFLTLLVFITTGRGTRICYLPHFTYWHHQHNWPSVVWLHCWFAVGQPIVGQQHLYHHVRPVRLLHTLCKFLHLLCGPLPLLWILCL